MGVNEDTLETRFTPYILYRGVNEREFTDLRVNETVNGPFTPLEDLVNQFVTHPETVVNKTVNESMKKGAFVYWVASRFMTL
jgi:hypothetical protein